jgi:hypothetical protein
MGIIVANSPALKVCYGRIYRSEWWSKIPRLKIVWNSTASSSKTGIRFTGLRSIFDKAPRIQTFKMTRFHITMRDSQIETLATVHSAETSDKNNWDDVLEKPHNAYYGV